jgi:peptide-methionine (S)-S-oxide reductase
VQITFDPQEISYRELLEVFFTIHDPTQLNRQGHDVGTQYRSAMFYADDAQKAEFEASLERAREIWGDGVVTSVTKLGEFFRAEEYHQDFFAKNPGQGYCLAVALPKVNKVRKGFAQYVKAA